MFLFSSFLLALCQGALLVSATAGTYPEPPATFEANAYTTWDQVGVAGSRKAEIYVPFTAADGSSDFVRTQKLDLIGDGHARGYAHGYLMKNEITQFLRKLDVYFMEMVLDIDLSQFPEPLQKILRVIQVKGAAAAPEAFSEAMHWVWEKQLPYTPEYLVDELDGMAEGYCDAHMGESCDVAAMATTLKDVNMLPELIRMACTAFGAWGKATATGEGLIQLRALDFGGGPFVNYTVVMVHRDPTSDNHFVSVTFPGMVGVITGVSQHGIGVSEKVWMTYDKRSLQPGTYDGEADVFILRDILQNTRSRAEAEAYLEQAHRTWAIWIGIGDFETKVLDLVGYEENSVEVYTDVTAPTMTGQPYLESIAYVDKHPQPSHDGPNGTLPTALTDYYGNISLETTKIITQYHQTGDVHIASYDFTTSEMYVAIGRVNAHGDYHPPESDDNNVWKAYNRPYLKFSLDDLFAGF